MRKKRGKDKRTLMILARQERGIVTDPPLDINLDSMDALKVALSYFYRQHLLAVDNGNEEKAKTAMMAVASIAERLAPYEYPRLAAVKVASYDPHARIYDKSATAEELKREIVADLIRLGIRLPESMPN